MHFVPFLIHTIVLKDHQPFFTHCDFQRKNILVRDVGDGYSLIIIDWEASGWYPSYWEFANALFACGRWEDDWSFWVLQILDPFFNEYSWMQRLRTELWS
ncbi:uncharacterized protein LY89DRAFT_649793 [Mollisia scopiformis]|uniref:Aminoglycoside phosphotransferase domain-containing protein n=1 Tax=Mollisia scopiformis TaxID=149040 RepID=A0A194X2Q6_MOLSC|nr:uncharacterized protein LY89DRAFT_649793 [Mollisia scopiformis]KUJ14127.1 hypothetical protein LY89DRAFT_649793 [Mollisia scopiformis]